MNSSTDSSKEVGEVVVCGAGLGADVFWLLPDLNTIENRKIQLNYLGMGFKLTDFILGCLFVYQWGVSQ